MIPHRQRFERNALNDDPISVAMRPMEEALQSTMARSYVLETFVRLARVEMDNVEN